MTLLGVVWVINMVFFNKISFFNKEEPKQAVVEQVEEIVVEEQKEVVIEEPKQTVVVEDTKKVEVQYPEKITKVLFSRNYRIQFETNSAIIKNESKDVLEDIFKQSMEIESLKIGVYGYTDDIGDATSNQRLSELRANSVKEFLEGKGIKNYRVEAKGFGEEMPINCENTKSGNNPDRRVVNITLGE